LPAKQPFKRYPIGYFHIDIAEVRTAEGKLYLFVAVDRTTNYAFAPLVKKATGVAARAFLDELAVNRRCETSSQGRQFHCGAERFGYFDVRGSLSGKKYRIHFRVSANIQEIGDDGKALCGWCFAPDRYLVPGDVMLAQKIALETSECTALAIANQFPPILPNGLRFAR
jgi:hypothetical protein